MSVLGETNDEYLQDFYDYFLQTFTDNFRLDTNLMPANALINSSISIVEYNIYNKWYELDEDGFRTGNFRICEYSYDPASNVWNTIWYPMNQTITVPDSLTQKNIPVEHSLVSAQIRMTVTKLPYIAGIFDEKSNLEQEVYYVRNADIKEHEDLIKDREDSTDANQTTPPADFGGSSEYIPYTVNHWLQNYGGNPNSHDAINYTLANTDNLTGERDSSVTPLTKYYEGFTAPASQTITINPNDSSTVDF